MLEIFITIGVIGWFARTAKSKGKSGPLWGFIGAISYFGPVLVFGKLIFPEIVKGSVTYDNQFGYMVLGTVLNLAIGIGCCLSARQILLSQAKTKAKGRGPTRKVQKKILIVAAALVGLLLLIGLLQYPVRTYVQKKWYDGEVGRNAVYGKITSIAIGAGGRGTIHVQSFNTGKIYTFYTGIRTEYDITRHPTLGESAKVYYINDRGYLKATYIR